MHGHAPQVERHERGVFVQRFGESRAASSDQVLQQRRVLELAGVGAQGFGQLAGRGVAERIVTQLEVAEPARWRRGGGGEPLADCDPAGLPNPVIR